MVKKFILPLALCLLTSPAFAALRGTANQVNTSTGSSATVTVSGIGIQSGDIVLMFIADNGGTSNTLTSTGFSSVLASQSISAINSTIGILCKVAGGSEPSTYTASTTGSADLVSVQVRVYSGRSASCTPGASASTASSSGTSPVADPLTGITAVSGDDVVAFWMPNYYTGISQSYTASSGFANAVLAWNATMFASSIASEDEVGAVSGATGPTGGTVTIGSSTINYAGYVLALAPGSSCTHTAYVKGTGALTVPVAGVTLVYRQDGSWGTVDCLGTGASDKYWTTQLGGEFVGN